MRITLAILALGLLAGTARADDVAGDYDVTIDETATTCDPKPETLGKTSTVHLAIAKSELSVKFATIFKMVGTLGTAGQINAKTLKIIGTSMAGLSARYSVVGHATAGTLDLVLTAQYIRQDTNKPHCAISWTVSGHKH